jgi:hypothetical protein
LLEFNIGLYYGIRIGFSLTQTFGFITGILGYTNYQDIVIDDIRVVRYTDATKNKYRPDDVWLLRGKLINKTETLSEDELKKIHAEIEKDLAEEKKELK